jgi:hypothetical protein
MLPQGPEAWLPHSKGQKVRPFQTVSQAFRYLSNQSSVRCQAVTAASWL